MEVHLSEENNDDIQLDYFFTTGQNGFISIEVRKFEKKNGAVVLVYAKYSGMKKAFDQYSLLTFDYSQGQLFINRNLGLPETLPQSEFLNVNIPDSERLSTGYNLNSDQPNSIDYFINPHTDEEEKWIKMERIIYTWDGNKFSRISKK
jgi:hypothetical protein